MLTKASLALAISLESIVLALAQESSIPPPTPTTTSAPSTTRSVRLRFIPPPMQGTISLGIYDTDKKIVRVLKQEADLDEFEVGDDGLNIVWDGRDDDGVDLPAGKYHARGYVVGPIKVEAVPLGDAILGPPILETPIQVRLVHNPLERSDTQVVDLDLGHDDENAFLRTGDGLPLVTLANLGDVEYAAFINRSDQALTVLLRRPNDSLLVKVSQISKMMAFDCGEFELK